MGKSADQNNTEIGPDRVKRTGKNPLTLSHIDFQSAAMFLLFLLSRMCLFFKGRRVELFIVLKLLFYTLTHILYTHMYVPLKSRESFPGKHLPSVSRRWRTEL